MRNGISFVIWKRIPKPNTRAMGRSKPILSCIATKSKQITSSGLSGADTINILNPSEIIAEIGRRKVMNKFIYKRKQYAL